MAHSGDRGILVVATQVAEARGLLLGGSTIMGDKSPKSKQRDQKQKTAARAEDAAQARSKQDSHSHVKPTPAKVTR
jgi:hypothetical protein